MKFANRMDRFGEGVFSMLAQMKKKKLEEGEMIVDLSIGAPNIAPAPHILKALSEACLVPENYLYAITTIKLMLTIVSLTLVNDCEKPIFTPPGVKIGFSFLFLYIISISDIFMEKIIDFFSP